MKIFSSEFGHNYNTYTFAYAQYCMRESGDKLSEIYENGYLPYSGSPDIKDVFYMARSARVPLDSFAMSSENRRVATKFDGHFERKSIPIEKCDTGDPQFIDFCANYFAQRHGQRVMPEARLRSILNAGLITHVTAYSNSIERTAYVLEVSDKKMTHFWYSFYDLRLAHQSLGMWLLLDSARHAKERGEKYLYIGTVYGEKALYKTAFQNIEYWDGSNWIADHKKIKKLGREDDNRVTGLTDSWKKELKLF